MLISIIDGILISLSLGVLAIWIYFAIFVNRSLRLAPTLDKPIRSDIKIDIILPARNEARFIGRCLDSLLRQDYKSFRIIAIDDCSTDDTASIINEYAKKDERIIYVHAGEKPEGWTGKNWACYQGYLRSDADILLFTDADTVFASNLLSLAIGKFITNSLDALTIIPRILCLDPFTKITLPLLNNILYSRYSPLKVNDSKHKLGYFFGSFFIIKRSVYESIGTHKSVRDELVEDGALGAKVKSLGYKLMMVRGEEYLSAVWARNANSLFNGLARLIAPLRSKKTSFGILIITFFIFLFPFIMFIYAVINAVGIMKWMILIISIVTIIMMIGMSMLQAKNLKLNPLYGLGVPIGAFIIVIGFLRGVINLGGRVRWSDREYIYKIYKADGFQP